MPSLHDVNYLMALELNRARRYHGMSVAELSRRAGIEKKRLWYLMRGQRSLRADELVRLCVALEVSLSRIVPATLWEDVNERRRAAREDVEIGQT